VTTDMEKVEGVVVESTIYVGGQETTDVELGISSSSRDLTPEEEEKILYMYKEEY